MEGGVSELGYFLVGISFFGALWVWGLLELTFTRKWWQCSWCRRYFNARGFTTVAPRVKEQGHGICRECAEVLKAVEEERERREMADRKWQMANAVKAKGKVNHQP